MPGVEIKGVISCLFTVLTSILTPGVEIKGSKQAFCIIS